jgi:hypothetical protein
MMRFAPFLVVLTLFTATTQAQAPEADVLAALALAPLAPEAQTSAPAASASLVTDDEDSGFTSDLIVQTLVVVGVVILVGGLVCQQGTENESCLDSTCGLSAPTVASGAASARRGVGLRPPRASPVLPSNPLLTDR